MALRGAGRRAGGGILPRSTMIAHMKGRGASFGKTQLPRPVNQEYAAFARCSRSCRPASPGGGSSGGSATSRTETSGTS